MKRSKFTVREGAGHAVGSDLHTYCDAVADLVGHRAGQPLKKSREMVDTHLGCRGEDRLLATNQRPTLLTPLTTCAPPQYCSELGIHTCASGRK